jgi:hypothetical protein
MKKYEVTLNFTRPILGSQPADPELRKKYITAKMIAGKTGMSAESAINKVEDEIENLKNDEDYQKKIDDIDQKGLTIFHRNKEGKPSLADIQIRGFIKDAFEFVAKEQKIFTKKDGSIIKGQDKYRDWIGERVMFDKMYYQYEGEINFKERTIRVMTMMGPRVSITASEQIENPSPVKFIITTTDDVEEKLLKDIFDRGMFKGMSQWANGQFGTFEYELKSL